MFRNLTKSISKLSLTRAPVRQFSSAWQSLIALSDEQQSLREMVEKFGRSEIEPIAHKIDDTDEFPKHLFPLLGELGLLGMTVPSKYGGSELGYFDHCLAVEEIS